MPIPETLLDTDTLSEIIKRRNPVVGQRALVYARDHDALLLTSVTAMEILRCLHANEAYVQLALSEETFSRNREIVPAQGDYRLAAEIVGALSRQGTPIGVADPLIAACAIIRSLPLATGNARHFGFVQAAGIPLRIEDWRQG